MFDVLLDKIKALFSSRLIPLMVIFLILFGILINRVFEMQIAKSEEGTESEEYYGTRERDIKSARGNFYDRNGKLLAYNELNYAVVISESALLTTNADKNAMILKLINLLEKNGYEIELDFEIVLNEKNELKFTVKDTAELRFKKNAYCLPSVNDLDSAQRNATPEEVFKFLKDGNSQVPMFSISDDYTLEEQLKIMTVRYAILITSPKYTQITLASDLNEETVAAIKENLADLPGVEVIQQTYRVYNDSKYFAHMIGYTGLINSEELETLNAEAKVETDGTTDTTSNKSTESTKKTSNSSGAETSTTDTNSTETTDSANTTDDTVTEVAYSSTDYVGKTGLEKEMESYLKGTKGVETITINDSSNIISVNVDRQPVVGNDVYLTIDRDLQVACYNILEHNIAAILLSKINNGMDYGTKGEKASNIRIPIYEVYNALLYNNVIDITEFKEKKATDLEKKVYQYFLEKRETIYSNLKGLLKINNQTTNTEAGDEMQEYLEYVYNLLTSSDVNIVMSSSIDKTDKTYLNYKDGKISLSSFLKYAISKNWVDLSQLDVGNEYYSTDELYEKLIAYTMNLLSDDSEFEKKIYRTLVFSKKLTGREICLLLFDQGVLEYNESDYEKLSNGNLSSYEFMREKISNLEITPGQLALEPCSGSIVVTDVNTGDVLAMVSYPSYDNNKLANKIDWNYYQELLNDKATPLNNRPTSQKTTTGSTFKPLSTLVGLAEDVIDINTTIADRGVFDKVDPSPSCWIYNSYHGTHGLQDIPHAIMNSCNYFFYEIGYRLATDKYGYYDDALGISKFQKYAEMFGLSTKSGVECAEALPEISPNDAVRTAIGYYHNFAPVQISRYISTIANSGTCFNYTLVDKVDNKDGELVYDNEATVYNKIDLFSSSEWEAVQKGMYLVVNTPTNGLDSLFGDLSVKVAGKTGTAQISTTHAHHALFVAYAPYEKPEISVTVVIPNGYASANAAKVGREVMGFYFDDENKEELLSGDVKAGSTTNINISD